MTIFKLALVAAALTVGSGAAYADSSRASQIELVRSPAMTVGISRMVEAPRNRNASQPTIFGHALPDRMSTRTIQVWGHTIER